MFCSLSLFPFPPVLPNLRLRRHPGVLLLKLAERAASAALGASDQAASGLKIVTMGKIKNAVCISKLVFTAQSLTEALASVY